jgi:hypothetical protein
MWSGQRKQGGSEETISPSAAVKSFYNLDHDRVKGPVDYKQSPPVGGDHASIWQNCGFYSEPVRNETAVDSVEHEAVWITYRPGLPAEQVDKPRELATSKTYVLVSPYPDLQAPVVASAWGKQLRLDSAKDLHPKQFVATFRQGPQTPEPGTPCTGGTSKTVPQPAEGARVSQALCTRQARLSTRLVRERVGGQRPLEHASFRTGRRIRAGSRVRPCSWCPASSPRS